MKLEDVLRDIYGWGLFHILLAIYSSLNCLLAMYDFQANVYMIYEPSNITCNTSQEYTWISTENYLSFQRYGVARTPINESISEQCYGLSTTDNNTTFKCESWSYSNEIMNNNILIEKNLVCEGSSVKPWFHVIFIIAMCFGNVIAMTADVFGRKKVYLLLTAIQMISNIGLVLVSNLVALIVILFFRGVSTVVIYMGISQVSELISIRKRAIFVNLIWLGWTCGYLLGPGMCFWLKDWRSIKYVSIVISLTHPILFFLFPKSPRWLLLQGRFDDAIKVLRFIAKFNLAKLPPQYFDHLIANISQLDTNKEIKLKQEKLTNDGLLEGLKNTIVRNRLLILIYARVSVTVTYYGLLTTSKYLSENLLLNNVLQAVVEFPGFLGGWLVAEKFGRRMSCSILCFTSSSFMLSTLFMFNMHFPKAVVGMVGKLLLTCGCSVTDLFILELLPTTMRNSGYFICVFASLVISSLTPLLNNYFPSYVSVMIFTIPTMTCTILIWFFLPETKNYPMPNTVEEASNFIKGREKEWADKKNTEYSLLTSQKELEIQFE